MSHQHEPRPEFLSVLEERLAFEARRQEMFPDPEPARRVRLHGAVLALLVVLSMTVGAGGVVAAERIQIAARAELLMKRARIQLSTAVRRAEFLEKIVDQVKVQVEHGRAPAHDLQTVRLDFDKVEHEVRRLRLVLDEVERSGRESRDELSADLVQGIDFVQQRLQLALEFGLRSLSAHTEIVERVEKMVEVGLVPTSELLLVQKDLGVGFSEIEALEERIDLRKRYIDGKIPREVVELLGYQAEARGRLRSALHRLEHASKALEITKLRFENGSAPVSDLSEVQAEVIALESDIELAEVEIQLLQDELPVDWREK